ncbi:hypothetical protein AB833_24865 [Chromatiales bacterium (ex Bugula neritina AB1)]|nr:hypothetical protein AB833_24865 [Chromatiales bacterium (ex Bugula neritina AB1)]
MAGIEEILVHFVESELLNKDTRIVLTPDFPLLEGGVIDSVSLQRLVAFIEDEFDISVSDEYMEPASFSSIGSITKLVSTLRE